MKFITLSSISCFIFLSFSINASVITQSNYASVSKARCPDVDEGYIAEWADEIAEYGSQALNGFPSKVEDVDYQDACSFNAQGRDGSEFKIDVSSQLSHSDNNILASLDNDSSWANAVLDETYLSAPESHMYLSSNTLEQSTGSTRSVQSYVWTGEKTQLNYTAKFNFSFSGNELEEPYWGDFHKFPWLNEPDYNLDSFYSTSIRVDTDMEDYRYNGLTTSLAPIAGASYSTMFDEYSSSAKNTKQISTSFWVDNGDVFYLQASSWGWVRNGGWLDSKNTLRSELSIEGSTKEESEAVFLTALHLGSDSVPVPEPSTLFLMLPILGILLRRSI